MRLPYDNATKPRNGQQDCPRTNELSGHEVTIKYSYAVTKVNTMTRKDYKLVAGALHVIRQELHTHNNSAYTLERIAKVLAVQLQADNPRFDRARFLAACGVC